jgi:hypothetical protein
MLTSLFRPHWLWDPPSLLFTGYWGLLLRNGSVTQTSTFFAQKLALTSPTNGGSSVGIVHSLTQATEFFMWCLIWKPTAAHTQIDFVTDHRPLNVKADGAFYHCFRFWKVNCFSWSISNSSARRSDTCLRSSCCYRLDGVYWNNVLRRGCNE